MRQERRDAVGDAATHQGEPHGLGLADPTVQHQDAAGRCSFEALVAEHCPDDPALVALARIVRGADFRDQLGLTPESPGLRAISDGFPLVTRDDHETVEKAAFVYDALYATLQARVRKES
jgi:hypothetical protein